MTVRKNTKRTNNVRKYKKRYSKTSRRSRTYKSRRGYKKSISKRKSGKRKSGKRKQKGGYKSCSLGYAMVKGMEVPAINNVEGSIQFDNAYAKLNSGTCNSITNNGVNHPVLKTH
jgi:hypothetical protein